MEKILILIILLTNSLSAQKKDENLPLFYGYVRSWFESDLSSGQNDFLIKMARLGVKGKVNDYAGYKVFVDFARLGSLKTTSSTLDGTDYLTSATANFSDVLLDAEVYIKPVDGVTVSLGQFKVPFSTDNLRSGSSIDFVNRPLLTRVAPGIRDVGVMAAYSHKDGIPFDLNAGLFNGAGQNKKENDKTLNYSARLSVAPMRELKISANYYGGKSLGADLRIFDFGVDYQIAKFTFSGEYASRTSELSADEIISNAYFVFSYYDFEFDKSLITHIIPAFRYEVFDPNIDNPDDEIGRITLGFSMQFAKIDFARFRINYELYNYEDGRENPDKIIFEFLGRF